MTTTWVYEIPTNRETHEGWAWIVLDSRGRFSALSDYGNYGYWWKDFGEAEFREYVRESLCNPQDTDYLVKKLGMDQGRELDVEATQQAIRQEILDRRRESFLSREEAREEWDLVTDISSEHDLHAWYDGTKLYDASELIVYDYTPQVYAFVEKVMPRLKLLLSAERTDVQK